MIFVTGLRDTASKRKEEQERGKKKNQSFESVLKEACAETEKKEISYATSGYTKNGMAFYNLEKRREYV